MSRVALSARRAALLGCGLAVSLIVLFQFALAPADASPRGSDASASIVNGRNTTIERWPWQVALTASPSVRPRLSTVQRFFCGGAVLAPRLVITAGHCVSDLNRGQIRQVEVVSGRTNLNAAGGEVARVTGVRMPVNASGKRRYRSVMGAADWDVALLTLATPLTAEPIKLAGPDEAATWRTGRRAWTTGWGITRGFTRKVPARLQVAGQVLMGKGLCRRTTGADFKPDRMLCLGGPKGNATACSGDSGGPLVVPTSAGYRLVGLTSFGDGACRGVIPSVDTRVSGDPIRRWVTRLAFDLAGVNVVGSGGSAGPLPAWCRVPEVFGLRPFQARRRLEARGCRLGAVRTDPWAPGRRGRIVGYTRLPGWLAPPGFRVRVWVASGSAIK